jgi:hypothetical protein
MNNARRKKLIAVCRNGLLGDARLYCVDEPHGGITYGETTDSSVNVAENPVPFHLPRMQLFTLQWLAESSD